MAKKNQTHNPALLKRRPKWDEWQKLYLWSVCAGRCELCNQILYENWFTLDRVNIGKFAHVIAHADKGPRAQPGKSQKERDCIENIMLLCDGCHTTVDRDEHTYTIRRLQSIKQDFENKIRLQTEPTYQQSRKMLIFTAPIGDRDMFIHEREAIDALSPEQYPMGHAHSIRVPHAYDENNHLYWSIAKDFMDKTFRETTKDWLGNLPKIAVFGLGPQPLLVYLGYLIGEAGDKQVFQRHRDKALPWKWPEDGNIKPLLVSKPVALSDNYEASVLALSLSVSFNIKDRVSRQLPKGSLHWDIHPDKYSTEFVECPEQLHSFRVIVHETLNEISNLSSNRPIHVYMAVPVSMAITFGMSVMRKATSDIILHDYIKSKNTDVETITIKLCQ
ncbi:SAVED domain-containing protein [uncultured Duncaniella sp.]|jgi:hypothetical protein|uniref:SAVED domain-containing protein n=1 Tax=uncultured Duncaniella sp. TaxID=2768039 RepID=UPI000F488B47|nr:SAVED domain-containing protein [uncultured Duncaniella sp.]ROT16606.1 SAVED domain-containing protein [Muribaculaceae bacterium Isolate-105 (HZI)]